MTEPDLTLPAGSRLVHIGFPKTGTTSLQGALHVKRDALRNCGIVYPGNARYQKNAGVYISQAIPRRGDPPTSEADWLAILDEVNAARPTDRIMISSEWLSETPTEGIERVVKDLGPDRVHIIATLRPLVNIMPSAWQQYLQNGNRIRYERWLEGMLIEPPYEWPTPSFWARHRHDEVLTRWAEVAGPENVTAIIVDSRDHTKLLRQFSELLAVPDNVLVSPPERDNRSLTWPEAEMLRLVNKTIREEEWPDSIFRSVVRLGVVEKLFESLDSNAVAAMPKIGMPNWAAERASAIGQQFADNIGALGIRIVGDLDSLGRTPAQVADRPPAMVPAGLAADAILAAITASLDVGRSESEARAKRAESETVKARAAEEAARRAETAAKAAAAKAKRPSGLKRARHTAGRAKRKLRRMMKN
jgi:hypothetical protein